MLTRRTFFKLSLAAGAALVPTASAQASSSLPNTLAQLEAELKTARTIVANFTGPLPSAPRNAVAGFLSNALSSVDHAVESWELLGVLGQIEDAYSDSSLPLVAAHCAKLIRDARSEELSGRTGWQQRTANHLATIKSLITRPATGYKARAGIV